MPKKAKPTKEQQTAEEFFPVDESDVKHAVEKEYTTKRSPEIINTKKTAKRKYSGKKTKEVFFPKKINLKENGYELVVTEKPQAALKIASALGEVSKKILNNIAYYEVDRNEKKIIVACAVGHLFTLKQNASGTEVPVFDIIWVPNYLARKKDFTKKYFTLLSNLAKNAGSITIATDYDIEGEVIGLNIMRFICGQEDANRMKFSTLTNNELNKAYEQKSPSLNWGQAIAGETRHYIDWYYGINLSRALMNAIKTTGRFKIMSIGRVQGPTLNIIVKKEREIQSFKSKPYWPVFITVENEHKAELKYIKDLFNTEELKKFENLVGKIAEAKTTKKEQFLPPNSPFNLTTLQTEVYKFYGITPSETLRIAQSLYLSGVISYPRTSSQKLPASIAYKEILNKLAKKYHVEHLITREKPVEGKKTDSAHPSIYPTGQIPLSLSSEEKKIYELIARRFISLFCDNAIFDNKKIIAEVTNEAGDILTFSASGSSIRKKAWMEIYPTKINEKQLPDIDGKVKIINSRTEEKETQPPKRYSPASIISQLEKKNLGTKATRATILETLYDRGYIREKSIEATPLGISLITTLEKYSPIIIDEKLTRSLEDKMNAIAESKISRQPLRTQMERRKEETKEKARETIIKIAQQFKENDEKIGQELLSANIKLQEKQKEENLLNVCPVCKKGILGIIYSRKTKRNFIACNKYPECKTTFSLPPNSLIKRANKLCDKCHFPMLMSLRKGKKPWIFCFNPQCETNRERLEKYRERKGEREEGNKRE